MEVRDRHKQTEISVVETIGGHGRWSSDEGPEFLSNFALYFASNIDKAGGHGRPWVFMGGGVLINAQSF